jgi:hypothetical protein
MSLLHTLHASKGQVILFITSPLGLSPTYYHGVSTVAAAPSVAPGMSAWLCSSIPLADAAWLGSFPLL